MNDSAEYNQFNVFSRCLMRSVYDYGTPLQIVCNIAEGEGVNYELIHLMLINGRELTILINNIVDILIDTFYDLRRFSKDIIPQDKEHTITFFCALKQMDKYLRPPKYLLQEIIKHDLKNNESTYFALSSIFMNTPIGEIENLIDELLNDNPLSNKRKRKLN